MELFILRHAEAVDLAEVASGLDADRHLSDEGKMKLRLYAKSLKYLGVSFDLIYSSPYKRAMETAEIAAEMLDYKKGVEKCDYLLPGGDQGQLFNLLQKHIDQPSVLLVGHEPSLGLLASMLISGKKGYNLRFKKCGLCLIEINEFPPKGLGELIWFLTPKIMKNLKK
jgi:phosphohistidine phosphatase